MINFDEFMKVDLRIAKIIDAENVEAADKLIKITADLGNETRTIFAGIKGFYEAEDLIGRNIVVAANLEPRKMRFGVSEGMLLAAGDDQNGVFLVARTITIFFRAIPEFIIAMILVIAIGFGAMPGVLALGIHTMGFLAKFYAEDIEHVSKGPIEALKSSGASKRQIISFAIIPQILPSFIANNLYILDRNIRMATMLGIVGAGGIGYELQSAFRMFEYPKVSAIIIIIFVAIFLIDNASSFIRSKIK